MSDTTHNAENRNLFSSISFKIILLSIFPVILFACIIFFTNTMTVSTVNTQLSALKSLEDQKSEIEKNIIQVEKKMLAIMAQANQLTSAHSRLLLTGNSGMIPAVEKARDSEATALSEYAEILDVLELLIGLLQDSEVIMLDDTDIKQLNFLTRSAIAMPNLYNLFVEANMRTIDLVKNGDVTSARNNYVFEEAARQAAVTKMINKSSEILTSLSDAVETKLLTKMAEEHTQGRSKIDNISYTTYGIIIVALILLASFVSWYALKRITKPIKDLVGSMLELSSGNNDVDIPEITNDEIGDMASALEVFKDSAKHVEQL